MQRDLFKKTRSSTLEGVSENGEEEGTPRFIGRPLTGRMKTKYAPADWHDYFDSSMDLQIPNTTDISFV
ncbi:hypothetical protein DFQ30_004817 [Apophysomyces sp. BC1015]|nr:hypothetical protein DFQ30_004817 [Apophysomyces sp. BC1015]